MVTMRTVCRCTAAVGYLDDEKSVGYAIDPNPDPVGYAIDPNPDLSATPSTPIGAVDGVADMPPGLSATPATRGRSHYRQITARSPAGSLYRL
jgi:hypothetical protein